MTWHTCSDLRDVTVMHEQITSVHPFFKYYQERDIMVFSTPIAITGVQFHLKVLLYYPVIAFSCALAPYGATLNQIAHLAVISAPQLSPI